MSINLKASDNKLQGKIYKKCKTGIRERHMTISFEEGQLPDITYYKHDPDVPILSSNVGKKISPQEILECREWTGKLSLDAFNFWFRLYTEKKRYKLSAFTVHDRDRWIKAFQRIC